MRLRPAGLLSLLGVIACTPKEAGEPLERTEAVASGPRSAADTCGAAPLKRLVGRDWNDVQVKHYRGGVRVSLVGQAVTEAYHADRLNIVLTESGEVILDVWCG